MLEGKVIIVTGGNGLIGKSIINNLLASGAICVNLDLRDIGIAHTELCDVTDNRSIDLVLKSVLRKYGKIDGLVNNAYPRSKDWGKKFPEVTMDSWNENLELQLGSYFYLIQQVSSLMKKGSSIVSIGSIYGSKAPDFNIYESTEMTMPVAYSAIKGAVISLTRYAASFLGEKGIRVNSVSPGGIYDSQNPLFVNRYVQKVPLGRMGDAEDIAPMVAFLLSSSSSYITGQDIIIDGGLSIK